MTKSSTPPRRYGRVGHAKSRNGCMTCKIRRVKCGEEKPQCYRCTNTGRQCDYKPIVGYDYHSWSRQAPTQNLQPNLTLGHPFSNILDCSLELRAFEFFFERGMPVFSGAINTRSRGFWKTCVMQACHTEPIIWDAVRSTFEYLKGFTERISKVIAVSALFEHPQYTDEPYRGIKGGPNYSPKRPVKDRNHLQALLWYNRSLSKLRCKIDQRTTDASVALISCILYICIELLQDNVTEVLQLYHRGVNLLSSNPTQLEASIEPLFYNFSALGIIVGYITPATAYVPNFKRSKRWSTLEEAETALYAIVARCMAQDRASAKLLLSESIDDELMAELEEEQRTLKAELDRWYQNLQALNITLDGDVSQADKFAVAKMLLAHAALRIYNHTCTTLCEMANDECLDDFKDVLYYGRFGINATRYPDGTQPPFSLETSIALPLFICATKCRYYRIRHEALDLLREAPKVQGLCKSTPYALMAAKMIALEEEGLEFSGGEDGEEPGIFIPEHRRISNVAVIVEKLADGQSGWSLKFTRREPDDESIWRIVEQIVPF